MMTVVLVIMIVDNGDIDDHDDNEDEDGSDEEDGVDIEDDNNDKGRHKKKSTFFRKKS